MIGSLPDSAIFSFIALQIRNVSLTRENTKFYRNVEAYSGISKLLTVKIFLSLVYI